MSKNSIVFTIEKIDIVWGKDSSQRETVTALIAGPIAIHESLSSEGFSVTHTQSTGAFVKGVEFKKAVELAAQLWEIREDIGKMRVKDYKLIGCPKSVKNLMKEFYAKGAAA